MTAYYDNFQDMKGIILNFSIESDRGAISGDDGNRYNFSSHNWKDTKEFPKRGLRVDFDIEEKTATEIYLALEEIRPPSPTPQKQSFSISESGINLEQEQILGIIGSLILFLGIFTPLIRFPWLGTLSLTSSFNCLIVIVLAIASFVFSIKQNYQRLWFTGISSLFFTFLNFVSFFQKIVQTKATLNNELANNTYGISGGFVAVAGNFIQFEWGWIFLLAGSALLIAAAYLNRAEIGKQILIELVIFGFLGSLLVFVIPTFVVAFNENQPVVIAKQAEVKNIIGAVNRAQQAFHFEKLQFSNSIEDLGLNKSTISSPYYNIAISEVDEKKAVVIATAKERGFKSYAGAVSFSNGQYNVITCITINPSKEVAAPIFSDDTFKCASGSKEDR